MEKKRSKGVTIFAWFYISGSFISIYSILILKSKLTSYQETHFILPDSYYYVVQGHSIIFAIAGLIIGIGLLKLLKWARLLSIIIIIADFICSIIFYLLYTQPYIISYSIKTNRPVVIFYLLFVNIINLLYTGMVIYFFTRPKVKEQFKYQKNT